ncbi:MAG TPA: flagellar export protein FliJ [Paucimonas sp.]|nr:flagellar export protein FliJ [Paucimonas sp.]HJW55724.1 flagellar export protein FliJ [Burkholderiaceae bacterium]
MAHPSSLDTLIELATTETDAAAKKLGSAIRAHEETEKRLALLLQYRDDYAIRFQSSLAVGLTAAGYRNFQLFLDKLDTAIAGQQNIVNEAQKRIDAERSAWQASERKRMSYDTLAVRARQAELRLEVKRDQKQTDELAARLSYRA